MNHLLSMLLLNVLRGKDVVGEATNHHNLDVYNDCVTHNYRVASGVRKIIDYQFFPPYYRLIIDFLTLYRPILSIFLFSGYLARLCTQPSEDFKNRLIVLTLTMYFKYCSLGKLEILKSWKYKRLSTKYKGLSTKLSWNLENIKDYRLNYRLFGKLSTI